MIYTKEGRSVNANEIDKIVKIIAPPFLAIL
jgi:hypothetical protein